ncbi:hypothetical protein TNCV_778081 [Trichonephila clavipes]|nr:hypothetical protein TNCV_778081 [Trichonephila clavipes]
MTNRKLNPPGRLHPFRITPPSASKTIVPNRHSTIFSREDPQALMETITGKSSRCRRGLRFRLDDVFKIPLSIISRCYCGHGSRVVKVLDRGWPCHEFEPSTTKDPPCRAAMHDKSVENSNVVPLVWYGS